MRNSIKNVIVLLNILMIILAPMSPVLAANDNGNGGHSGNDGGNSGANSGGNGGGNSGGNSGSNNAGGNSGKDSPGNGNNGNGGADKGNAGNEEKKDIKNGGNSGSIEKSAKDKQAKADRKSVRESKLKKISSYKDKPEKNDPNNKSKDNIKNLLLDIHLTDDTPYFLKQQSYGTASLLQGYGEDSRRLEKITELMNQSLNRSLWLDNRHILSSEIFKYDMHAAQDINVLIDREKNSTLPQDDLIYSFIKLIQSDKMIAYIGIQDMEKIVGRMPAEKSAQFEKHLDKAINHFEKAEDLIGKGSYVPAVQHYNNAWNESFGFLIQNGAVLPPQVFIEEPAEGSYTNSSDQRVAGAVFDLMVFFMTSVNITMDGTTSTVPLVNGSFEHNVTLKENLNTIEVSAVNYFGNMGTAQANVTLDTVQPVITITGIAEGAYYAQNVSASVEFVDLHLGATEVLLDGKPYTSDGNISSEGRHDLTARAIDLAGNTAYKTINFTIDRTQPEVRILYPANGTFVRQTLNIDGNVSDLNLDSVSFSVDGVKLSASADFAWDTTGYSDGAHTITLDAVDKAGNSASTSVDVLVDNTLPAVIIKSPLNFYLRQGITIDADVTDTNLESISVKMDGSEISTSLPYQMDTSLYPEGNHTIEIYGIDKAGNLGGKGVKVNFDNTAPDINITSPLNASFVKHGVEIRGIVNDPNLLAYMITVDGTAVSNSLPYLWDSFAYSDGNHTIRIDAADKAGNRASKEITVKVDNTLPSVQINFPPDGAFVKGVIDLTVDVFDANLDRFQIFINGVLVAENQTNFRWNTSEYPDGAYMIEVVAYDQAGNEMRRSINVTVDNTIPKVNVTELIPYPTLDTEYALLITTEAGVTITVNNMPLALDNGSAIYRSNVTLGINNFVVTAVDRAGNTAAWSRTMLVDEDDLPDWYETNVTGTDPLDGDSDSSLTVANEADNGIRDDREDFDSDRLLNRDEFAYGTDPFKSDTDGDGLTDWYELRITGTSPLEVDTDGNGVNDQNEDPDGDLLNNLMEQGYDTNPLSSDTDEDGLTDHREIIELKTNPIKKDTDNDYLDDNVELKPFFSTNPLNPDTNGNGIMDGNETYEQIFRNTTLGVEVAINASNDREDTFIFRDVGNELQLDSDALVGRPVDIMTTQKFSTLKIKMYYSDSVTNESDLGLFYFDETNHSLVLPENQGVNTQENYVWAEVNHLSTYQAGDIQKVNSLFASSNPPATPLLRTGEEIRIFAKVHNIEKGDVENAEVSFFNGDPAKGGELIGKNYTAMLKENQSEVVSVKWRVKSNYGLNIFIKVDSSSIIMETKEDNNMANRTLDKDSIDSDNDGLTDNDEVNGLRTAMGATFFTNPNNPDTDGDGLDDGKEMGHVKSDAAGNRYYYLFSYPGTNATGITVTNSADSDGDHLSDKEEYDFGSSALDEDTDGDWLSDYDEWQLHTKPDEADSDADGLTDWWETTANASVNKYGHTDPMNRYSDNDTAIDGGEMNVYRHTSIDTNRDGIVDYGNMDLNGDGIIEMGEENDYETDPNNYTYFVDVFVVVDEDYKQETKKSWNPDNWRTVSTGAIKEAGKYFLNTYQIKLNISQIDDNWDSNEKLLKSDELLDEAINETHWIGRSPGTDNHNSDILLAFTGQDSGLWPFVSGRSYGVAYPNDAATIVKIPPAELDGNDNLVQHEISHLFGAPDHTDGRYCVMDKTWPWPLGGDFGDTWGNIWKTNDWDTECINIINSKKLEVSLFREGGDYDITN